MSCYKKYPPDTLVRIKVTGEIGEAFESLLGYISVWVGDETKCRYFRMNEVEFLKPQCNESIL